MALAGRLPGDSDRSGLRRHGHRPPQSACGDERRQLRAGEDDPGRAPSGPKAEGRDDAPGAKDPDLQARRPVAGQRRGPGDDDLCRLQRKVHRPPVPLHAHDRRQAHARLGNSENGRQGHGADRPKAQRELQAAAAESKPPLRSRPHGRQEDRPSAWPSVPAKKVSRQSRCRCARWRRSKRQRRGGRRRPPQWLDRAGLRSPERSGTA